MNLPVAARIARPIGLFLMLSIYAYAAKLKWAVSIDGRKIESETYKILALLDPPSKSNDREETEATVVQATPIPSSPTVEVVATKAAAPIPSAAKIITVHFTSTPSNA